MSDETKQNEDLRLNELNGSSPSAKPDSSDIDEGENKPKSSSDLEAVYDVPVLVSAVLGKSTMQINKLLKLDKGAIVQLDRKIGEAVDIFVNNRLVARGEVVVIEDRLGITMTEIIKSEKN